MILIDFSGILYANTFALSKQFKQSNNDAIEDILRHSVLTSILSINKKFHSKYGHIVIACDNGSKRYWRKELFPHYKASRATKRDESGIDWNLIYQIGNNLKKDLREVFGYIVIEVETAEADDVIASLVYYTQDNDLVQVGLVEDPQPVLIVSKDHDFLQLQRFDNVSQYNTNTKQLSKITKADAAILLHEHIVKGDSGDGVPNILSSDDSLVSGANQTRISKKFIEIASYNTLSHDAARNYDRNKSLVDLSCIPPMIMQEVQIAYKEQRAEIIEKTKTKIFNYFIKHRCSLLMQSIEDFA